MIRQLKDITTPQQIMFRQTPNGTSIVFYLYISDSSTLDDLNPYLASILGDYTQLSYISTEYLLNRLDKILSPLYNRTIDYFIEVLTNGRASDLKEAMNLFEEQLHRWKIEDMTKSTMIAQQQTAANSAAIRSTSAINAAANVASLLRR